MRFPYLHLQLFYIPPHPSTTRRTNVLSIERRFESFDPFRKRCPRLFPLSTRYRTKTRPCLSFQNLLSARFSVFVNLSVLCVCVRVERRKIMFPYGSFRRRRFFSFPILINGHACLLHTPIKLFKIRFCHIFIAIRIRAKTRDETFLLSFLCHPVSKIQFHRFHRHEKS